MPALPKKKETSWANPASTFSTEDKKIKANGDALSAFGHTEQLPLKPAGPQEKTPPRRCNGFLKHRFALEGKKPPNHKIRVGLCILTEEENEWA